ncbi:hypothetical protein CTEN210_11104 [Chaetoceros tenuissimus]|uniref:Uncharacterized protein n=1 Tax=Chaetoceros tenuissimus TaxID=426638 RepID=A0AAD3CZ02_9STRA|nr:hypothetical protein CTEN210_11104 [Chaetoceros tenuissimus]
MRSRDVNRKSGSYRARRILLSSILLVYIAIICKYFGADRTLDITSFLQTFNYEEFVHPNGMSINDMNVDSTFLTMYGQHRVKPALEQVPKWLSQYVTWSQQQRANENEQTKYLVLPCIGNDICEGFSDRLRALPFYILLASKVNRVLCIYWTKPYPLESFLQPPKGGLDWRCPASFDSLIDKSLKSSDQKNLHHFILFGDNRSKKDADGKNANVKQIFQGITNAKDKYVSVTTKTHSVQSIVHLNSIFDAYSYRKFMPLEGNWYHVGMMEHIFRIMFEPIDPIARTINATMTELGLNEKKFTSVHVRARYPSMQTIRFAGGKRNAINFDEGRSTVAFDGRYKDFIVKVATNAVDCGFQLEETDKIFFSSDLVNLTQFMLSNPVRIKNGQRNVQPVGIAKREDIKHAVSNSGSVEDFYPMVEDLLIMGASKCVSLGIGSYGAFAAGIAGNRCKALHRKYNGAPIDCPNDRGVMRKLVIDKNLLVFGDPDNDDEKIDVDEKSLLWDT